MGLVAVLADCRQFETMRVRATAYLYMQGAHVRTKIKLFISKAKLRACHERSLQLLINIDLKKITVNFSPKHEQIKNWQTIWVLEEFKLAL